MSGPAGRGRDPGFSLMELVAVAVILAVLAAVLIPLFGSATETARRAQTQQKLAVLEEAYTRFHASFGAWPTSHDATDGGYFGPTLGILTHPVRPPATPLLGGVGEVPRAAGQASGYDDVWYGTGVSQDAMYVVDVLSSQHHILYAPGHWGGSFRYVSLHSPDTEVLGLFPFLPVGDHSFRASIAGHFVNASMDLEEGNATEVPVLSMASGYRNLGLVDAWGRPFRCVARSALALPGATHLVRVDDTTSYSIPDPVPDPANPGVLLLLSLGPNGRCDTDGTLTPPGGVAPATGIDGPLWKGFWQGDDVGVIVARWEYQ